MTTTEIANRKYVSPPSAGTETSVTRTPKNCKYFHTCSANLCPLDPEVSKKIWLPEDNVRKSMAWYERREKLWLARHPERKKLSMEEVQRRRANMKTLRERRVRK